MNPAQRQLWEAIRIVPEKWALHPYGDAGGGFWVVGITSRGAVWFNDIEDGFNRSSYRQHGVIDDYFCNQDELEVTVQQWLSVIETARDVDRRCGPPEAI